MKFAAVFIAGSLGVFSAVALTTIADARQVAAPPVTTQATINGSAATANLEAPTANQRPDLPPWAFTPSPPRKGARPPDDGTLLHVPGSTKAYTRTQINDGGNPPDWFPDMHPLMPNAVAHGGKTYSGCAECHLANGNGKPDTAALNGLPAAYIEQQIEDFRNGGRHASVPRMSVRSMLPVAMNITPTETKDAAEYFASVKPVKWIRVVESDSVPKTEYAGYRFVAIPDGGTEPIGNRVVELPISADRTDMRDASSGFVAYVPKGSIAKGEVLVQSGGGKTTPCVMCHGKDLRGMGTLIPPIAGRSPSSAGRQIYDFKSGARDGANASLMKAPVAPLTDEDIVNIVSYLSSLPQ
jgi:cytochrome c553